MTKKEASDVLKSEIPKLEWECKIAQTKDGKQRISKVIDAIIKAVDVLGDVNNESD